MSASEYRTISEEYWSRPEHGEGLGAGDARAVVEQVLSVCGPGRTLDAGCGMGSLVRALLARGVDATGLDVAATCVDRGNGGAPGRFVEGSLLEVPFAPGSFDTVTCVNVLEHLDERDVDRAIAELARVARGAIFLRVWTGPDPASTWRLTVRPREWWEERLIAAGLRKHPAAHRVIPYDALEREGGHATLIVETLPEGAAAGHPLESLRAGRDLHMDMLREAGRRSDAHAARYAYALPFVRTGDTVLDAACGLGYGSAILALGSGAARVVGVDADADAVAYAKDCYGADRRLRGLVEFRAGTLPDLAFLADRSVDLVTCFETLEHVRDPAGLLAEFRRVLTPGGRLVVSVPNEWTDDTGRDPNPHHLHVYTWDRLAGELSREFLLERGAAQTAGGGMKLTDRGRRIVEAGFASDDDATPDLATRPEAEWWLAVAMKSPIGAGRDGYRESTFDGAPSDDGYHLTAFARDYDNPWLVRSIVSVGQRATRPGLLRRLARDAFESAAPGSPDAGAALCVLAYQELDRLGAGRADAERVRGLLARIDAFQRDALDSAHAWRWRISNRYAAALLRLGLGDRAGARAEFEACAGMDCARFSPLLASKTVDAAFQAGAMAAADGDLEGARRRWIAGVREAHRVLSGPWLNVIGSEERPVTFGLPEVAVVADLAARCGHGLDMLARRPGSPAQVWAASQTQSFADIRRWAMSLAGAKEWIEGELDRQRDTAARQSRTLEELRAWSEQQHRARAWLEEQRAHRDTLIDALRARLATLEEARAWSHGQAESWRQASERRDRTLAEMREWNARLTEAKHWLEGQVAGLRDQMTSRDAHIAELRAWSDELIKAKQWLEGQLAGLHEQMTGRDQHIAELRAWTAELVKGKEWLEAQWRAVGAGGAPVGADGPGPAPSAPAAGVEVKDGGAARGNGAAVPGTGEPRGAQSTAKRSSQER